MYGEGYPYGQDDHQEGQKIHLQSSGPERVEEARTDLKSYREHEQDQSEILHE